MARKPRRWSFTAGSRPNTVTVEERAPGGPLYVRVWKSDAAGDGHWIRRSLGHRDREKARAYALDQVARLERGRQELRSDAPTVSRVFREYLRHRSPRKVVSGQAADRRCAELWARVLGPDRDPHRISLREWERFVADRAAGAIDSRGHPIAEPDRRPVRARAVEFDCNWLRWVFNWAVTWQLDGGGYLMRESPVRGFTVPKEKNPRRPVATQDRYEALRSVSDRVPMSVAWTGQTQRVRSHLSELLDIVAGTGRRLSAVCRLTYEDVRLAEGPHGAIRWPANTDKGGREWVVPVSPQVRRALDRVLSERPGIGAAPLFPAPGDPRAAVSRHLAGKWLRTAEKLAGLSPMKGSAWHAFRRKWATERKHLPDVDVAAAGGWKSLVALKQSYQLADQETMLRVVLEAGELREGRG